MSARRSCGRPRRQRGVVLIIMALIALLGVSWLLVSALSTWLNPAATNPNVNGRVLGQAKAALLGYVAADAMTDNNPGSLPCPEPGAYVGTVNEGIAAGNCTLPAVGRLPWRTLGLDRLQDASGQPLWYVVSPLWALPNSLATLNINFSTQGQLTVDGQANAAVALIIAPGPPLSVQGSANCTARAQARDARPPDYRDYLECQNASGGSSFATYGPGGSFNDQVLQVTRADVMRVLEGPIAQRIQRDIAPLVASAAQTMPGGTASVPIFPFAQAWANPTTIANPFGSAGTLGGLLPLARSREACAITDPGCDAVLLSKPCTPGTDPQCNVGTAVTWAIGSSNYNTSVSWNYTSATATWTNPSTAVQLQIASDYSGNGRIGWVDCSASSAGNPGAISCTVWYGNPSCSSCTVHPRVTITASANQVGLGFRQLNNSYVSDANSSATFLPTYAGTITTLASTGNATVSTEWQLPWSYGCSGWWACKSATVNVPNLYITDNVGFQSQLRDVPATDWFLDNNWQQWTYYAVSQRFAPGGAGNCSGTTPPCLTVSNYTPLPNDNKQALLVFSGRALAGRTQPSSDPAQYFEAPNATGSTFEKHANVTGTFNDRVLVISP